MQLELIQNILYENLKDVRAVEWRELGSKYYHGLRTAKLAVHLRKLIFPEMTDKDDVITVAAWYHDILNRGRSDDHPERGAELTRGLIGELVTPDELEEIVYLIRLHDTKIDVGAGFIPDHPATLQLLQDADYLDHFGSVWMWDVIRNAALVGDAFHDVADRISSWSLEYIESRLVFDESKKIASDRFEFMRATSERIKLEAAGDIYNEAELFGGAGS